MMKLQTRPIGDVPRHDHEWEDNPDVYGKEGMIVEKSAGLSDDRNDHPYMQSNCGYDSFGGVGDANDVYMC
jgi:hypothetical protein